MGSYIYGSCDNLHYVEMPTFNSFMATLKAGSGSSADLLEELITFKLKHVIHWLMIFMNSLKNLMNLERYKVPLGE